MNSKTQIVRTKRKKCQIEVCWEKIDRHKCFYERGTFKEHG